MGIRSGKVFVSKTLVCGRTVSHAGAVFCFFRFSELLTAFSWVARRSTKPSEHYGKAMN